MRTLLRFLFGMLLSVFLVALIGLNAALIWIATGPRPIDNAIPFIEREISAVLEHNKVSIGKGFLLWDGWRNPVGVKLQNMRVFTPEGAVIAEFQNIDLGLDITALLMGHVVPDSVVLRAPYLRFSQHADGSVSFGLPANKQAKEEAAVVVESWSQGLQKLTHNKILQGLKHVSIQDADVDLNNEQRGIVASAQKVSLTVERHWRSLTIEFSLDLPFEQHNGHMAGVINMPFTRALSTAKLQFVNIVPSEFAEIYSDSWLSAMQFPLSGWVNCNLTDQMLPADTRFMLRLGQGRLQSQMLEGGLDITSAQMEGDIKDLSTLTLTKATANFAGSVLDASGTVRKTEKGIGVMMDAALRGVPVSRIRHFWPTTLSPLSRQWVISSITGGDIAEANVELRVHPGDFALPRLRDEAIQGTVAFSGAKLRYKPAHPEVTDISGVVHVNANALSVDVKSAHYMSGSVIQNGKVNIADLNVDNPRIETTFQAIAPAADAAQFLSLPDMQHAQRMNIHPESVKGNVNGQAKLGFNFLAPRDAKGNIIEDKLVDYDIRVDVEDVGLPQFMHQFDIAAAQGALQVANTQLTYHGKANVNQVPAEGDVRVLFTPDENGLDTFISASATGPVEALKPYGYPDDIPSTGKAGVKADIKLGNNVELINAALDLTQVQMRIPQLQWEKPAGRQAAAEVTLDKKDGKNSIPSLSFSSGEEKVQASLQLGEKMELQFARVSTFRLGKNDNAFDYEPWQGGKKFTFEGEVADMSPLLEGNGKGNFSFEDMPVVNVQMKLKRVIMGQDRELRDVSGHVECLRHYCSVVAVQGLAAGEKAPFSYHITQEGAVRRLEVKSSNAGAFLYAFNLFDGIKGGELLAQGVYDDSRPSRPLKGKLIIGEHSIQHAPLLAKLLALASLTGFVDTLQGNGITFKKLTVPFILESDVVTLKDARSYGPAVGLTADGTIKFPGQQLDLKGVVIPSYTLNSFFGKVPLIGQVLTGGEGQGIIAARYSMEGTPDDAEVSVNPLSILTPGFLRNVFDIFDKKPEGE